ncbi:hypothetical protein B0A50_03310 [Salinomyces thailandicus]|uniref:Metallo-beta-lactamase domain-containing protein n=1 Tax=Salinomyces thailandicus TaxID=706561 RepID=A0A4V5N4R8_9PEZI|nr:hypothetical protein B0A50_03310 [Salinomyces thailandica]
MLLRTPAGNILWDLIPFLDREAVDRMNEFGGFKAIVISHPHYYSTCADWCLTFKCPVYVGVPDRKWLERIDTPGLDIRFLEDTYTEILTGSSVTAVLVDKHFPGSLLMHWKPESVLFIADTIFTAPLALNPVPGKEGVISFTFWYSVPNRIPLHPDDVLAIWQKVKGLEFQTMFGAFEGQDVRMRGNERESGTGGLKGRLLESCKIFAKAEGWREHEIFSESL